MPKVAAAIAVVLAVLLFDVTGGREDRPSAAVEVVLRDAGRPASAEEIAEWCGGPEGRRLNGLYSETLARRSAQRENGLGRAPGR